MVATATRRQKSLTLIRAREVATNLSIPISVLDRDGSIVFFNGAAEVMHGLTFEEAGELSAAEWPQLFAPAKPDGTPMSLGELPVGVALLERRPVHETIRFTGADGVTHEISVTAFPLMGREDELHGAMAIFWSVS